MGGTGFVAYRADAFDQSGGRPSGEEIAKRLNIV
jgi:hypothetical protein